MSAGAGATSGTDRGAVTGTVADGGRAYRRVLDQLGRAIISGELSQGRVVNVEWAMEQTGASRSVVREATRVLVSLGLLVARQRVGLTVTASSEWEIAAEVMDRLDLDIPHEEDLDEVLPAGDLTVFDDLGLDAMELGAILSDVDAYADEMLSTLARRLGFADAYERVVDALV